MASSTLLRDAAAPLLPTALRSQSLRGVKLWPDTSLECLHRYERGTVLHEDWRSAEGSASDAQAECGWTRRWQRGPSDAPTGHPSYERLETRSLSSEERWPSDARRDSTAEGGALVGESAPPAPEGGALVGESAPPAGSAGPSAQPGASDPPAAHQPVGSNACAEASAPWAVWRCSSVECKDQSVLGLMARRLGLGAPDISIGCDAALTQHALLPIPNCQSLPSPFPQAEQCAVGYVLPLVPAAAT
jgi:hypothetical protein